MKIPPEQFALVCFLVLMANGGGLRDKSPSYIAEKVAMLSEGLDAFGRLDIYNMRKVRIWCEDWGVEFPAECAANLMAQEKAVADLAKHGITL